MQIICRILQLSDISIMAVERDKSRRGGRLLRMSTRDSVPLRPGFKPFSARRLSLENGLNPGVTYYTSMEFNRPGERSPEKARAVGGDRRFNILSGSRLQLTVQNSNKCSDALVCIAIGNWKTNVIGSKDGDR